MLDSPEPLTRKRGCSLLQRSHSPAPGRCRLWLLPHNSPAGASPPPDDHRDLRPASRGTSAPCSAARCCCIPGGSREDGEMEPAFLKHLCGCHHLHHPTVYLLHFIIVLLGSSLVMRRLLRVVNLVTGQDKVVRRPRLEEKHTSALNPHTQLRNGVGGHTRGRWDPPGTGCRSSESC